MDETKAEFLRAGQNRVASCGVLLAGLDDGRQPSRRNDAPAAVLRPQLAAYLLQVGLECLFKAYLLQKAGVASRKEYEERIGPTPVFSTAKGHALGYLADIAGLRRLLADDGKDGALLEDGCWARMTASQRPYSLRYGTERLAHDAATAERDKAAILADVLQRNVWAGGRKVR